MAQRPVPEPMSRMLEAPVTWYPRRKTLGMSAGYEKDPHQPGFSRAIGGFQLTQQKLMKMLLELNKGTLLALHIGRMKDKGTAHPAQISFGKLNNVREALEIAREARSVLGASGVTLEYPVIRHMNNLESVFTCEGTNEIHTLILGEAITGLNAFT